MVDVAGLLRPRVRLVGGAAVAGAVIGALFLGVLALWAGDPRFATRKAFGVGAVVMGFGLLGWSGTVLAGDGYEAMQDHLETGTDWTERKGRRAMARLGGFGVGWMVAVSLIAAALPT